MSSGLSSELVPRLDPTLQSSPGNTTAPKGFGFASTTIIRCQQREWAEGYCEGVCRSCLELVRGHAIDCYIGWLTTRESLAWSCALKVTNPEVRKVGGGSCPMLPSVSSTPSSQLFFTLASSASLLFTFILTLTLQHSASNLNTTPNQHTTAIMPISIPKTDSLKEMLNLKGKVRAHAHALIPRQTLTDIPPS